MACLEEDQRALVVAGGGIPFIISTLKQHNVNDKILTESLAVIANASLGDGQVKELMGKNGVVEALVPFLQSDNPEFVYLGCVAVRNLTAANPTNKATAEKEGTLRVRQRRHHRSVEP